MIGRLFFDDRKVPVIEKILLAADLHLKKAGRVPEIVLVHREALQGIDKGEQGKIDQLPYIVRPYGYILPNHFLVGYDDQEKALDNNTEESPA